jgi:hypothetical protein
MDETKMFSGLLLPDSRTLRWRQVTGAPVEENTMVSGLLLPDSKQ